MSLVGLPADSDPWSVLPCATFEGQPFAWQDDWEFEAAMHVCSRSRRKPPPRCCQGPNRRLTVMGKRETTAAEREASAGAWLWRLFVSVCPSCGDLEVVDLDRRGQESAVELILCDGCDALAGIGFDVAEARANAGAAGAWTGGAGADWDLCPACAPGAVRAPEGMLL